MRLLAIIVWIWASTGFGGVELRPSPGAAPEAAETGMDRVTGDVRPIDVGGQDAPDGELGESGRNEADAVWRQARDGAIAVGTGYVALFAGQVLFNRFHRFLPALPISVFNTVKKLRPFYDPLRAGITLPVYSKARVAKTDYGVTNYGKVLAAPIDEEIRYHFVYQELMMRVLPQQVLKLVAPRHAAAVDSRLAKAFRLMTSSLVFASAHASGAHAKPWAEFWHAAVFGALQERFRHPGWAMVLHSIWNQEVGKSLIARASGCA